MDKKRNRREYEKLVYNVYNFIRICNRCWITEDEHKNKLKRRLSIHHIDNDFTNNKKENIEILCISCHMSHHWKNMKEDTIQKLREFMSGNKFAQWAKHTEEMNRKKGIRMIWNKYSLWKKFSEERREKMRWKIPWNKWIKHTEEEKKKMSLSHIWQKAWNKWMKKTDMLKYISKITKPYEEV